LGCNRPIKFIYENEKWKPIDPDGNPHDCYKVEHERLEKERLRQLKLAYAPARAVRTKRILDKELIKRIGREV
jgi:hypothetical protein